MRANPGGQLAGDHVVGRDRLIARLWSDLESTGVVLTGERRLGKTCIVKKMHCEPPKGVLTFYQDLEGCHSAAEFVAEVLNTVRPKLSKAGQAWTSLQGLLGALGGTEIGGVVTIPAKTGGDWAALLRRIIGDLVTEHAGALKIVLFWDELPQMLYNVAMHSPQDAMALLDVLRSLRQQHPRLRMVYTGSIGLPAVLARLRRDGYGNAPTNDMLVVTVTPLSVDDASQLATALLRGERVEIRGQVTPGGGAAGLLDAVAREIAESAEGVPYYVHHLVRSVASDTGHLAPGDVAAHVSRALTDPQDPWQLRHYRTRIDRDYEASDRAVALAALDALACEKEPVTLGRLHLLLSATPAAPDLETVRRVMGLLEQDHYVRREPDAAGWTFRLRLLARWWRENRELV